jgi:hypothetical protein
MIPTSHLFDQSTMTTLLENDPVIAEYRSFFSFLDWSVVDQWKAQQSRRGRPAQDIAAYIKAFLIRIREGMIYTTQLRKFLLKHPLLIIELGFDLHLDPTAPYGFDAEKTLPCRYWLGERLRDLDQGLLQSLLQATVHDLKEEIPGLGETVAFDVKHIYAWVKENNERVYVKDRYDKTKRLAGDPDCRLGVKRSTNQVLPDGSTKEKNELIWGYGTGVAAAFTVDYGDVVLAEYTQPFNENDISYFRPLYQRTVLALNDYPTNITADAAYDARVGSMSAPFVMEALQPFHSPNIVKHRSFVKMMELHIVPRAYSCILRNSSSTHTAIALNASNAPYSFHAKQVKHVTTNNSPKERAVSKMSIGKREAFNASPSTVPARSTRPFTLNAPPASVSTAKPKNWGSSDQKYATAIRLLT